MYLRARLDTCADINLMPASVYQLLFKDPQMKKLTPSNLQVGTYTTDSVKIVGSCKFHLVHPDTKKLLETTFYVAMNDGSILLLCKTTLQLGLIQPRARLDYLPPRASLITSSADHPKKTKRGLTYPKETGGHPKESSRKINTATSSQREGPQADNKQGNDLCRNTLMSSKGLASSWGQITIYRWIQAYHPKKHLADQTLSI